MGEELNPLNEVMKLFGQIITHDIIYIVLIIISIIVIYMSRSSFDKFKTLLHSAVKAIQKIIAEKKAKKAIKKYNHHRDKVAKVREDTMKQLQALNDPAKEYAALQYFFQFPSAIGFKAIIEKASDSDDADVRDDFICNLCESLRAHGWYDI